MPISPEHPGFYERSGPHALSDVARAGGAEIGPGGEASLAIRNVVPLDMAEAGHVAFLDNKKYLPQLAATRATACFLAPDMAARAPAGLIPLVTKAPYRAFAQTLALFYPGSGLPLTTGVLAAKADPSHSRNRRRRRHRARRRDRPRGAHRRGNAHRLGRGDRLSLLDRQDSYIGPCASVAHAIIGDSVILHAGVRIGQDGFGFAMGAGGHLKVPQIGRVLIDDDVEIGANSAIDRGALKDTVIGQGTKIDNLVQIGHNVIVGRNCVLVGAGGDCRLDGAWAISSSWAVSRARPGISSSAPEPRSRARRRQGQRPAGRTMGGTPAQPLRSFAREMVALRALVEAQEGLRSPGSAADGWRLVRHREIGPIDGRMSWP